MSSEIDPRTLLALGVELTGYDVPIPLYCQRQMVTYWEGGVERHREQPLPLSFQYLVSIVLQIGDPVRFRRYSDYGREKKKDKRLKKEHFSMKVLLKRYVNNLQVVLIESVRKNTYKFDPEKSLSLAHYFSIH